MNLVWIDDDSYRTKTIRELLEFQSHVVHFFSEYAEGYDYLKSNRLKAEAVILDIMMPPGEFFNPKETNDGRTTGLHLYKLIRKFYRGPILLYTIFGDQGQIEYFIRNDAKARYLAKPASDEEIMGCIHKMK
jgi:DNA-binding NarL/FixJ family response regulator